MHLIAAAVLAVTALSTPSDAIVLRTGERISVSGGVTLDGSRAVFRTPDGALFSLPLDEIDVDATANPSPAPAEQRKARTAAENKALDDLVKSTASKTLSNRTLVVSEEEKRRLLEELKDSRGIPVDPRPYEPLTFDESESKPKEMAGPKGSAEWYWRDRARGYQERVRQQKENLQMLVSKEQQLSDEIIGFLNLGYNGNQFSYQVLSLARVRDQIPYARLELERAERALTQFMDDARRQGILPGWLR
ncbi:MAG: hypothetical protein WC538_08235 [Thermoanaerobaculia bacterium]|jgi:hypothetical protein